MIEEVLHDLVVSTEVLQGKKEEMITTGFEKRAPSYLRLK